MNRGQGRNAPGPTPRSSLPHRNPVHPPASGGVNSSSSVPLGSRDRKSDRGRQTSWKKSTGSNSRQFVYRPKVDCTRQQGQSSSSVEDSALQTEKLLLEQNLPESMTLSPQQPGVVSSPESTTVKNLSSPSGLVDRNLNDKAHNVNVSENRTGSSIQHEIKTSPSFSSAYQHQESSPIIKPRSKDTPNQKARHDDNSLENSTPSELSVSSIALTTFDICPSKSSTHVVLNAPLFSKNRERRRRATEAQQGVVLKHGMVLLKRYFSCAEQVKIIEKCRDLGVGPGGFYQPGYRDGAKLQLKMMCLGKNWDPEIGEYGSERPSDHVKPPAIPLEFYQFVKSAIRDSHATLEQEAKGTNVQQTLPSMTPDICIVNFYTTTGRLGLHQDKDESRESINKGLPVVSFSFGDSAEFLYGAERDVDKADKVILESGDVLIFGGESRRIFHGVSTIYPNSAPKDLVEETQLRPGRLNLTFREY